jgi:hypothetical protein
MSQARAGDSVAPQHTDIFRRQALQNHGGQLKMLKHLGKELVGS